MPLKNYDRYYGGKGGAAKALAAMKKQYGDEKGEQVFYAKINKQKKRKRSVADTLYGGD